VFHALSLPFATPNPGGESQFQPEQQIGLATLIASLVIVGTDRDAVKARQANDWTLAFRCGSGDSCHRLRTRQLSAAKACETPGTVTPVTCEPNEWVLG
jgi:hypothetical protein